MKNGSKHSFLVVDDELPVLDSMYDLFRREFKVLRANNAREAKAILQQEPVHIVMSDQRMPDVTGVELLRQIRDEYPDTVRLIFTAYADIGVVVRAINEGQVFRYVTKGCDPDELCSVVRQAADYYELRTERKRLVAELQQANADLRQANALKAAFLDVASHELNTPVTIIQGMCELADEQLAQPGFEAMRSYAQVVRSGAKRLMHLVENMIKLLQAGSFQAEMDRRRVACRALFDGVDEQVQPFLTRRRQRLVVRVDPSEATLVIDQGKMHDAVLNLITNAIKFSPDGATIELSAAVRPGAGAEIEVCDEGMGVIDRDVPHIFDPFFSTFDTLHHSSGSFEYGKRGLGMGLAIVKKFVEMHGGEVAMRPRQPRGCVFIVQLPGEAVG
jgi:signal transduction histidine kinase